MQKKRRTRRVKPAKGLSESERENYIQWQLDLAAEPRRVIRFEFWCVMISSLVMMSPILLHSLFPDLIRSPFSKTTHPVAIWWPVAVGAALTIVFLYIGRRKLNESPNEWVFRSLVRFGPLSISALGVVLILTGTADLQRQFDLGQQMATWIDSRDQDSQSSPAVIDSIVLVFSGLLAATGFMGLYTRIVIKPSWLYQHELSAKKTCVNPPAETAPHTEAVKNRETPQVKLIEAMDRSSSAWYRVRLLAVFMYMAIGTSAYLYFAFGRQRYLHDPVAASFGHTAYFFNLILVGEGFRVWLMNMKYMWQGTTDSQVLRDKSARVLRFSVRNAAVALVYVWLLSHGGLDAGADLLMNHVIPGWSRLQAWILSNVLALFALAVLSSLVANRIDRILNAKRQRRRMRAYLGNR